jgi:hypothetical protein
MCASREIWFDYSRVPRDPDLIAWSPDHDGNNEVEHKATFHAGANEANPPFIRHRISWRDDIGCPHWVRYELLVEPSPSPPSEEQNEDMSAGEEVY